MRKIICLVSLSLFTWGCSGDSSEGSSGAGGTGGQEADRGIITDGGLSDGGAGGAGGEGGAGGMGGMGGSGGAAMMEVPIDDRCPDAQTGSFLLVLFPDRVDAYRQREFGASYFCQFLDLAGNGITEATGMAFNRNGDKIFIVQPEDDKGAVYEFDTNGSFVRRVTRNVNLAGADGIWNTFGEKFVVWSRTSENLYELGDDGSFRQPFSPPVTRGSRVEKVTDMVFLDQDSILMTFSNRPAKLFKNPFGPEFPADEIGPGNAVVGIDTEEGVKILMTAQIGGEGNAYGVVLYKAAESGRVPPEREQIIVAGGDGEIVDGIDLIALDTGLLVLDSDLAGTAKITSFNAQGALQVTVPVHGGGNPSMMMKARIFPDF
jgi:hypothetical protein